MAFIDFDILKEKVFEFNGFQITIGAIALVVILLLIYRYAQR